MVDMKGFSENSRSIFGGHPTNLITFERNLHIEACTIFNKRRQPLKVHSDTTPFFWKWTNIPCNLHGLVVFFRWFLVIPSFFWHVWKPPVLYLLQEPPSIYRLQVFLHPREWPFPLSSGPRRSLVITCGRPFGCLPSWRRLVSLYSPMTP